MESQVSDRMFKPFIGKFFLIVEMKNLNYDNALVVRGKSDESGLDLYNIFRRIQHRAVVCTSNLGDGGNETIVRGLVCGHAYSLLQLDEVELDDGSIERIGKVIY